MNEASNNNKIAKQGGVVEKVFHDILTDLNEGIALLDQIGCCLSVNTQFADLYKLKPEQMSGMSIHELIVDDDQVLLESCLHKAKQEGRSECRLRSTKINGEVFYLQIVLNRGFTDGGDNYHFYCFAKDISSEIITDDASHSSELPASLKNEFSFSSIFQSSVQPMIITKLDDGIVLDVNQAFIDKSGYSRKEIIGQPCLHMYEHLADREGLICKLESKGQVSDYETMAVRKNGEKIPVTLSANVIEFDGIKSIFSVARDISDRKQSEQEAITSKNLYQQLVEDVNVIVWELDFNAFCFTFVSEQAKALLGYEIEEWYEPKFWLERVHPDDRQYAYEFCLSQTTEGMDHEFEYRMVAKDGSVIWVHDVVHVKDEGQGNIKLRGVLIDITKRKQDIIKLERAEKEIVRQENRLVEITDSVPVCIAFLDDELCFRFINSELEKEFDFQRENVIGRHIRDVVGVDTFEVISTYLQRALNGEQVSFEHKLGTEGIDRRYYDITYLPKIEEGEVKGINLLIVNITESKKTESALLKTNRALRVLSKSNDALVKIKKEDKLLQTICEIVNLSGYILCWVGYKIPCPKKTIYPIAVGGDDKGLLSKLITWDEDHPSGQGPVGIAIRTGKTYVIKDLKNCPYPFINKQAALNLGFASVVGLPIKCHGETVGVLMINSDEVNAFDHEELMLLEQLTENLSFGIEAIRDREQKQKAEGIISLENYTFQIIAGSASLAEMLELIALQIESTINSSFCSMSLLNQEDNKLYNIASPSLQQSFIDLTDGIEIGPNNGAIAAAAYWDNSIKVDDIQTDPLWRELKQQALKHGLHASYTFPIRATNTKVLGTCTVYYADIHYLNDDELNILSRMSHILGSAIERYSNEEKIRQQEERYALALEGTSDGLWDWDIVTNKAYFSSGWKRMLGYDDHELENCTDTFRGLIHADDKAEVRQQVKSVIKSDNCHYRVEFRMQHKKGHYVDILSRGYAFKNQNTGELLRIVGTHTNITVQKQAAKRIQESERKFRTLYDDSPSMFFTLSPEGEILSVNRFGANHLGYDVLDLIGCEIFEITYPEDREMLAEQLRSCLESRDIITRVEFRISHRYADIIWVRTTLRAIVDQNKTSILVSCEDISEAKILSEQLEYQAKHDSLTGLINRVEFERRLRRIRSKFNLASQHALCYLDLDQFKVINDTCGHLAGDELLRRISDRLSSVVRKRDTLARLGGDEFAVLLEHCSLEQAQRVAQNILVEIENFRFEWNNKRFSLGVSIGLVPITVNSGTLTDIMTIADAACYAAKDAGRNRIHVYHSDDDELTRRRTEMNWVAEINRAIEEEKLELYVQPIASLNEDGQVKHHELLLRMIDSDGNIVLPGAFLPAAERFNLTAKLDKWVVKTAFNWLVSKADVLNDHSSFFINLSGHSLGDNNFMEFVIDRLNDGLVKPENICFEITETAAIAHLGNAIKFINTIKGLGCRFALDDFGTGLSSFNYLKNLPVDYLKIDGAFIRDLDKDPIDLAMVRSISEVGQVMGKRTIAEFVESREIIELLKEIGIDYAQGYSVGHPIPLRQLRL